MSAADAGGFTEPTLRLPRAEYLKLIGHCYDGLPDEACGLLAEGQVHGGLAQGIAQALFEEFAYDADGTPLTATLADYLVPSAAELPSYETAHTETPTPLNPLGAKGIGESGTIGATPAVQNAVIDAVSHLGVRHIDMPVNGMRVWEALQKASSALQSSE